MVSAERTIWDEADRYAASYRYLVAQENFTPGVGYVQRPGDTQHRIEGRLSPRSGGKVIRRFGLEPSFSHIKDSEGRLSTRKSEGTAFAEFESGDTARFEVTQFREAIFSSFNLREGVTIAPGSYDTTQWQIEVETFRRRQWRGTASYQQGGFWDGTRSDTKQFSKNVRFNWIPKQGTDFFLVYNETDQTRRTAGARDRSLTVKLAYRFAL